MVTRQGTRQGEPYHHMSYYLTSVATTARQFADGIRGHWGIENRLHWVKDVVLKCFYPQHPRLAAHSQHGSELDVDSTPQSPGEGAARDSPF